MYAQTQEEQDSYIREALIPKREWVVINYHDSCICPDFLWEFIRMTYTLVYVTSQSYNKKS